MLPSYSMSFGGCFSASSGKGMSLKHERRCSVDPSVSMMNLKRKCKL
jgi:hypothetical protein